MKRLMLLSITAILLPISIKAAPKPVAAILLNGDPVGGSTVSSLNAPFTNGNGLVGFTGGLANSDRFVWYDDDVRWLNSDAMPTDTLTGAEGTMGVGNNGEFVYSPSVSGDDAVWSHQGLLLRKGMQAPGFVSGTTNTFDSRPTMTPDGTAYWIAGINASGGTTTEERVFYSAADALPSMITPVIKTGDIIGGLTIDSPDGVGFTYWVSDNRQHHIHVLDLITGSTANDGAVYLDGNIIARESFPTGSGDNWSAFSTVGVNDAGDYVFAGDTDGPISTDTYIAYNGAIALREGDTVDGFALTTSTSIRAVSINDAGFVAHIWSISGGTDALFVGRGEDLANSSRLIAVTGDSVDIDSDSVADFVITDFEAIPTTSPGLDLAVGMTVYAEVELTPFGPGVPVEAILGFEACAGTLALEGTLMDPTHLLLQWSTCPTADAYWLYGADDEPFFVPGFAPGYEHRIDIFPPGDLDAVVLGPGDPASNPIFLVIAVTPGGVEMSRSNRSGEYDFVADIP